MAIKTKIDKNKGIEKIDSEEEKVKIYGEVYLEE